MTDLLDELHSLLQSGRGGALATIVRTRGSTPRGVGARMLVHADGRIEGTIGGGCGEAEVWSEAMEAIEGHESRLVEVDLLHDHDAEGGRACGGIMTVFIEPIQPDPGA